MTKPQLHKQVDANEARRAIKRAKDERRDVRKTDGDGLFFFASKTGKGYWKYDYRLAGKERRITLGEFEPAGPGTGINPAEARILRAEARRLIDKGIDPISERRKNVDDLGRKNFEVIAREWFERKAAFKKWVPKYKADVIGTLESYVFGGEFGLGRMNVDEIEVYHVTRCLEKYVEKPFRRDIVRRRLRKIFKYAKAFCHLPYGNPAADAEEKIKMSQTDPRGNMAALKTVAEVRELMRRIANATAMNVVHRRCLLFIALTGCRPHNARLAKWSELEMIDGRLCWVIARNDMKIKKSNRADFRCPLSRHAEAIIDEMRPISEGQSEFIFPRATDFSKGLNANACNRVLTHLGLQGVHCAHGFRTSLGSIMTAERRGDGRVRDLVELQLDHGIPEATPEGGQRAVYVRVDMLPERQELVDQYAELIAADLPAPAPKGKKTAPTVVPFRKVA